MTSNSPSGPAAQVDITASRQLTSWMAEQGVAFAFTTYQTGKLFLVGLGPEGSLAVFERTFNRCMGLCAVDQSLYMSTLYQLWRFENILDTGQWHQGHDRLYVPRLAFTTGDLDIHDIAVDGQGRVLFVNTLFSCLAAPDVRYSFRPVWTPPFISRLAAEDRCHLNGLALVDGQPRYLTCLGASDVADGWRDRRADGGLLLDLVENGPVLDGLAMPHSPRVHADRLWLLNSGTGHFGYADLQRGRFEPVTFCPGYLRGLSFHDHFAAVGLSKSRQNRTFSGLPLDGLLADKNATARCGIQVIDLGSGDAVHFLRIEGLVEELYDVVLLPGCQRPMALGFKTDEIRRIINVGPALDPS
ncbi:MAG: TIGR03032 family protein [Magnetococcales bacterium]|nr:TIGR03032 family protein [Magnetococcales bacterium]